MRVLARITRKIAKEWGVFMGQSERLYAGKRPIPRASPGRGPWWASPWGWGQGRGLAPSPPQAAASSS
ncbi:conserved protein of unknown function [Methanoculleus bourgensis]|uniref:Uncharacterized protein n=1 Tax=Methanoculleus bourgensis TaxID=83986 RepID=A0A0X3BHM5_9EURY|nr:conserved protein of unknown function [Methanoculleus bourgensis]